MTIEFKKFPSLTNTYDQKSIQKLYDYNLAEGDWIATEKLDGAHLCLAYDGETLMVGSRTQWVGEYKIPASGDIPEIVCDFFSCSEVIQEEAPKVIALWKNLMQGSTVRIEGELVGPKINGRVKHNKGFFAYDLIVNGDVFNKHVAFNTLVVFGFNTPQIVVKGSLEECLQSPNLFRSYATPEDYEGENWCEGTVIEPVQPKWFPNGERAYLKNKNARFAEKASTKHKEGSNGKKELPADVQAVVDKILPYATVNRVIAVRSKDDYNSFKMLLSDSVADALDDYEKDNSERLFAEKNILKQAMKVFTAEMSKCVRKVMYPENSVEDVV